ncbi:hypothetical protein M514_18635 [Trichuris suis]|uniref:Uncharacterized protein n=1 Tax=Trichuris suis TaxID=68888 RepID=A0A085NIH0_9BILA|nr:hypothetical protein M514_18635 [Trichuris suis]
MDKLRTSYLSVLRMANYLNIYYRLRAVLLASFQDSPQSLLPLVYEERKEGDVEADKSLFNSCMNYLFQICRQNPSGTYVDI